MNNLKQKNSSKLTLACTLPDSIDLYIKSINWPSEPSIDDEMIIAFYVNKQAWKWNKNERRRGIKY